MFFEVRNEQGYLVSEPPECKDIKIETTIDMRQRRLCLSYFSGGTKRIKNEYTIKTDTDKYIVKEDSKASNGWRNIVAELDLDRIKGKAITLFKTTEGGSTAIECASAALTGTGWTCVSTVDDRKRSFTISNTNAYKVMEKICSAYTCEIKWDTLNNIVYLMPEIGEDRGMYFLTGFNVKELTDTCDSYDYFTRIIPIGANGLTISSVNGGMEYLYNYQYTRNVKTLIWEDSNYTDAQDLKTDAQYKLNELSKPKKSYQIKIVDLAKLGNNNLNMTYAVGDTVQITDAETGTMEKQRIVKTTEYPDDALKNELELSNKILSFEEMQKKLLEAADCIENVSDGKIIKGDKVDGIDPLQIKGLDKYVTEATAGKVDKVQGKGLSTEDYTTTEKENLKSVISNQTVNTATFTNNVTLDTVALNGSRRVGKVVYVSLALSITATVGNNVTLAALSGYTANGRAYLTVFSSNTFLIAAYMENGSNAIKTMNVLPVGAGATILITGTIAVN